jgi:hypothetical protein
MAPSSNPTEIAVEVKRQETARQAKQRETRLPKNGELESVLVSRNEYRKQEARKAEEARKEVAKLKTLAAANALKLKHALDNKASMAWVKGKARNAVLQWKRMVAVIT